MRGMRGHQFPRDAAASAKSADREARRMPGGCGAARGAGAGRDGAGWCGVVRGGLRNPQQRLFSPT